MKLNRKGLVSLVLAVALVMTMMTSGTIAWFTDEVTSAANVIQAGNLDLVVKYGEGQNAKDVTEATTDIFEKPTLWEPGAVAKVKLGFNNEGNLALKYRASLEATNENTLNGHKLSEVIKVAWVNENIDYNNRDAVIAAAEKASPVAISEYFVYGELGTATVNDHPMGVGGTLVAYWLPGDSDNNYNAKNGQTTSDNKPLHIDFVLKAEAIQREAEWDSFGDDYDGNTNFVDKWDGTIPASKPDTLKIDAANRMITVEDADAFMYLSQLNNEWKTEYVNGVNDYYYQNDWIVSLTSGIDLNNIEIDSISFGWGSFEGNGNTIRNIQLKDGATGLFTLDVKVNAGTMNRTRSIRNLVLDGVKVNAPNSEAGALSGYAKRSLNNVTVKNANIIGGKYVGGLAGKSSSNVINCKVIDSVVKAGGKTVGGLVGYSLNEVANGNVTVSGNVVDGVTIAGAYNVGGMFGQLQGSDTKLMIAKNNTVHDTIVANTQNLPSDADATEKTADKFAARRYGTIEESNNVAENVTLPELEGEGLIKLEDNKYLAVDYNTLAKAAGVKNATVELQAGTYNAFPNLADGVTVNGNGEVTVNGTLSGSSTNATVRGVNFKAPNAQRWGYSNGVLLFENCTLDASSIYAIHYDGHNNADITYRNCKIVGWAAIGRGANSLTFEGCEIYGNGTYGLIRCYSNATIKNCTFDVANVNPTDVYQDGIHAVDCTITVENCKNVNGSMEDICNISGTGKIILDGTVL